MRKKQKNCLRAATALLLTVVAMGGRAMENCANKSAEELASTAEGRLLMYAEAVGSFREAAMKDPVMAVQTYFSEKTSAAWNSQLSSEFEVAVQADFFRGGILLSGPQNDHSGIVGIYNPWWDAMLLLKCTFDFDRVSEKACTISEFYFLSGETFRDEDSTLGKIRTATVVPVQNPLSVELWQSVSATVAKFEEVLAADGAVTWGRLARTLRGLRQADERCRMAARAGLRLKLQLMMLRDGNATAIGAHVVKLARDGNLYQLYSYFREPNSRKLLSKFVEIPEIFRRDYVLYGYMATREGRLYVIVNQKFPRFYVTVTVPADVPKTPASFEWFDLSKSAEMLDIWNARAEKEESK